MRDTHLCVARQVAGCASVGVASLLWGMSIAWSAVALPQLRQHADTSPIMEVLVNDVSASWIGSSMPLGGVVGGLVVGPCIQTSGRKNFMMIVYTVFTIGWGLIAWAPNLEVMCIGRAITGACSAAGSAAGSIYLGEISDRKIRGSLGSCTGLLVSVGLIYMQVLGSYTVPWVSAASCLFWCLVGLGLMTCMPESPYYLHQRGREEETMEALSWFHGSERVKEELLEITKQNNKKEDLLTREKYWDASAFKMLLLVCTLMILGRLSGIPAINCYTVHIFSSMSSTIDPNLATLGTGVTEVFGAVVAIFLIDIAGRKVLLTVSTCLMGISMSILSIIFYLSEDLAKHTIPLWQSILGVGSVFVFIFGFALGIAPVPHVLIGEVFSMKTKCLASTISVSILWAGSFLVSKCFFGFEAYVGKMETFIFFSACNFIAMFFVCLFIPETKGKSLSEIQAGTSGTPHIKSP